MAKQLRFDFNYIYISITVKMLMIKTSTKTTNSLPEEMITLSEAAQDLGEEEQSFYASIKKDLTKLEVSPKASVVEKLLNYSRSL